MWISNLIKKILIILLIIDQENNYFICNIFKIKISIKIFYFNLIVFFYLLY